MSRTRVIRVGPVDGGTPDVDFTPSRQTEGSGVTENNSGAFTLTNNSPNTQTHVFGFNQDFRTTDSEFNIPASRCIVEYKARPTVRLSSISGGTGVTFTTLFRSTNQSHTLNSLNSNFSLETFVQTGSDVTTRTANLQPIQVIGSLTAGDSDNPSNDQFVAYRIETSNNNSNGLHSVTLKRFNPAQLVANRGPAGALTRSWEADDIVIDASDPVVFTPPTTTLTCTGGFLFTGQSTQTATASIADDSVNKKFAQADVITSSATVTATANVEFNVTHNFPVTTTIDSTTENFVRMDAKQLASTTALSATPLFKPGPILGLSVPTTVSTTAGLILDLTGDYTWDSFSLNSYFEEGFSESDFALNEGEYTWTFLASSSWDDWPVATWVGDEASWDNWPGDAWFTPYEKNAVATLSLTPSFLLGDAVNYTGTFTLAEDTARGQFGEADLDTTITMETTATGTLEAVATITSAFSPTLTSNITYGLGEKIAITGAFNTTLTASAITDTFADIDVSTSISITPTFKPAGESNITVSTAQTLSPTFKPGGLAALVGFYSTLIGPRVAFQADSFLSIIVPQETRTLGIATENRIVELVSENRVNKITADTRTIVVPEETRRLKLRIPPMQSAITTPRVRSEQ